MGDRWVARMPFAEKPEVALLHVTDVEALRAPFMFSTGGHRQRAVYQEEIKRIEARGRRPSPKRRQMASLKLKERCSRSGGRRVHDSGSGAPRRDGIVAIGESQAGCTRPVDARQRLDAGHPCMPLLGADRQGRAAPGEPPSLCRGWIEGIGQDPAVSPDQASAGSPGGLSRSMWW